MNYTTQQDVLDFVEDNNVKWAFFDARTSL